MKDQIVEAVMTPAEKMESLVEAVVLAQIRVAVLSEYLTRLGDRFLRNELSHPEQCRVQELTKNVVEVDAQIVALVKTLMAGGSLEHCIEILRAETAGRL